MIYGDRVRNDTPGATLGGQDLYVRRIEVPDGGAALVRLAAHLDGLGGVQGQQAVFGVLYDSSGRRRAASGPVAVVSGQVAGIVDFVLPDGVMLEGGVYWAGVSSGPAGGVVRFASQPLDRSTVDALHRAGVEFAGAPPATVAGALAPDPAAPVPAVYVHAVDRFVVPAVPDEELLTLPWEVAQGALSATGPVPGTGRRAVIGWHGPMTDATECAAIVRSDGPLADLVGQRVRLTRRIGPRRREVAVYVADEQPWPGGFEPEDLSVSRRAWLELGDWALDSLEVTVEELA